MFLLLNGIVFISCSKDDVKVDTGKKKISSNIDLSQSLDETQSLAGIVTDEGQLFGGISAEGKIGDIKIYNNQAQFVIQQICDDSNYYLEYGGGLIDADIIGQENRAGYDVIDDYGPMIGFGRVVKYSSLEIIHDGQDGNPAHVRVIGVGVPFNFLQGALENFDMIEEYDMSLTTDYILEANTSLLKVQSTLTWNDDSVPIEMGSFFMVAKDIAEGWNPEGGRLEEGNAVWKGFLSKDSQLALALFSEEQIFGDSITQTLLEELGPILGGLYPMQTVEEDGVYTYTQYIGVGSDFASITEDWYTKNNIETILYSGNVLDDVGNGINRARVHILQDDVPINMVLTDEQGHWEMQLPENDYAIVATAQSEGVFYDVELEQGHISPYQSSAISQKTISNYNIDNTSKTSDGYGISSTEVIGQDLVLSSPLNIQIQNPDGIPTVIKLQKTDGGLGIPSNIGPSPTSFYAYVRDENMDISIPKGEYDVVIHRGTEWEIQQLNILDETDITIQLERAYETDLISIDSHTHSSPSADGKLSMEQRLVTHAAHHIDVHISTDHDHLVNYRPTLEALELESHLQTLIGVEVSPVLRGHVNMFPAKNQEGLNGGAFPWWHQDQDTSELYSEMRAILGESGIIQPNHPIGSSGMLSYAEYNLQTGSVMASHYSSDFQAIEVLNDGRYDEYLPYYLDLVSRGFVVTPTGVSDSHSHTGGVGENKTYVVVDSSKPLEDALVEGIKNQRVSLSRGALITVHSGEEWATGLQAAMVQPANIEIDVRYPSWMDIEAIEVWKNTEIIEEIPWEGESIQYSCESDEDAVFHFAAKGNTSMSPVYSKNPWSLSGPVYIDSDGDGWNSTKNPVSP
jgi:hypothetical protein